MKKKKVLSLVLGALMCVSAFGTMRTSAKDVTNFSITTGVTWKTTANPSTKQDSGSTGYVNWQSSDKSSHKEWFRLVNSNGYLRSYEVCISYKSNSNLSEIETQYGYYYYLQAKRENLIDPTTTVTGYYYS